MRPINLLPPQARAKVAARRRLGLWVIAGAAYLVFLGLLTVWFQGKVGDAEDRLQAQQALVTQLQAEVAELRDLAALKEEFDAKVDVVGTVLAVDVAWGRVLNDFARLIPPRVWLGSFTGSADPENPADPGQITVTGTGFDYPDVASWLRSLDSTNFPGVAGTWVNTVSASSIGASDVVQFASSTSLTAEALSLRFLERVPFIP